MHTECFSHGTSSPSTGQLQGESSGLPGPPFCRLWNVVVGLEQGFSAPALLRLGSVHSLLWERSRSVYRVIFRGIPGLYPLAASSTPSVVTNKNVS